MERVNAAPPGTEEDVLTLCREGKTAVEIAEDLNLSRNRVTGILAKNGGVLAIRGYTIKRAKYGTEKPTTRPCYACGDTVENYSLTDYRLCLSCRATASYADEGLGDLGVDCGRKIPRG